MDPVTILAALLPLVIEAGKYGVQRWLTADSVKPGTFAEFLELQRIELERFRAMQGGDGASYPWVAAVRQMQRPVFGAVVLCTWAAKAYAGEVPPEVANMAGAVGFYLFGDRTLFYVSGKGGKP